VAVGEAEPGTLLELLADDDRDELLDGDGTAGLAFV
jgi:hypothetical protein